MLEGFLAAISPMNLSVEIFGVVIGIIFGAIPGLTATLAIALFVPVTFLMNADTGMIMLGGIYVGGIFGGSISAILVNVPGTPASIVTGWEGYAMAREGKAPLALSLAALSSGIGGLLSALALSLPDAAAVVVRAEIRACRILRAAAVQLRHRHRHDGNAVAAQRARLLHRASSGDHWPRPRDRRRAFHVRQRGPHVRLQSGRSPDRAFLHDPGRVPGLRQPGRVDNRRSDQFRQGKLIYRTLENGSYAGHDLSSFFDSRRLPRDPAGCRPGYDTFYRACGGTAFQPAGRRSSAKDPSPALSPPRRRSAQTSAAPLFR